MSDVAIRVENLSKRYRIGERDSGADTLAAAVSGFLRSPVRNLRRLRSLTTFSDSDSDSDGIIWALKDVSFDLKRGEALGVIGRNGAGKSTLLKILSRITQPSSGRVELHGRVASLLEVGTGFHPELTGRENIFLNGTLLGMTGGEVNRKLDEIVEFSGVGKFLDTAVKFYSSGMRVRLAFAVAAFLEPEILLVDEVLAVGDLEFQKKCLGKMDEISHSGRTILFVSHQMAAVQSLCSKAIFLDQGRTVSFGEVEDTIQEYLETVENSFSIISLSERERRVEGEEFRFVDFSIIDAKTRNPVQRIISGQDVWISVNYRCSAEGSLRNLVSVITFYTLSNTLLFSCRSDTIGKDFTIPPGYGTLYCHIPKFPLNSGRYVINMLAYERGSLIEWIENAALVDVESGDYYGTGKLPTASRQGVFIEYDWGQAIEASDG